VPSRFIMMVDDDAIYSVNYMMILTCEEFGPVLLIYAFHVSHPNM
jgi:hypothetical protein